jgi:hypothetical protein
LLLNQPELPGNRYHSEPSPIFLTSFLENLRHQKNTDVRN